MEDKYIYPFINRWNVDRRWTDTSVPGDVRDGGNGHSSPSANISIESGWMETLGNVALFGAVAGGTFLAVGALVNGLSTPAPSTPAPSAPPKVIGRFKT